MRTVIVIDRAAPEHELEHVHVVVLLRSPGPEAGALLADGGDRRWKHSAPGRGLSRAMLRIRESQDPRTICESRLLRCRFRLGDDLGYACSLLVTTAFGGHLRCALLA